MIREEAITALGNRDKLLWGMSKEEKTYYSKAFDMAISALSDKKGEWNKISPAGIYECSCCGQNVMTSDIECYKFCHGCGAEMRGENNETDN